MPFTLNSRSTHPIWGTWNNLAKGCWSLKLKKEREAFQIYSFFFFTGIIFWMNEINSITATINQTRTAICSEWQPFCVIRRPRALEKRFSSFLLSRSHTSTLEHPSMLKPAVISSLPSAFAWLHEVWNHTPNAFPICVSNIFKKHISQASSNSLTTELRDTMQIYLSLGVLKSPEDDGASGSAQTPWEYMDFVLPSRNQKPCPLEFSILTFHLTLCYETLLIYTLTACTQFFFFFFISSISNF